MLSLCPFDISVGVGVFVIGLSQISSFFSCRQTPIKTVYTDSSKLGWGGVLGDCKAGDNWTDVESKSHINYLELMAVYLSLKSFKQQLHGQHVKVMVDNTTAVYCINHMGTSHSRSCNVLTKTLWEWCISESIYITAVSIPGVLNTKADAISRKVSRETEWKLNSAYLKNSLMQLKFNADIDLFASRTNKQIDKYVS